MEGQIVQRTIVFACNTKTCLLNKDGQCTCESIQVSQGKCCEIKSRYDYHADGTRKIPKWLQDTST